MTSTQGRRKHSACLLRMRENCPFRNLRRNKCCGTSTSSDRWRTSRDQPEAPAVSNCEGVFNPGYADTCPQLPAILQPYYHSVPQGEISAPVAMDSDTAPSITGPTFSSFSPGPYAASVPPSSNPLNVHQSRLSSSDASMDLDSAVDPETGERAQG